MTIETEHNELDYPKYYFTQAEELLCQYLYDG